MSTLTLLRHFKWAFVRMDTVNVDLPATFEVRNFTRTNWKKVCDLILVRHSNLGSILHPFGDIAGFCAPEWPHPYSPLFFFLGGGCSRWTRSPMLGSMWACTLSYSAVKLLSKCSKLPTCVKNMPERHRRTYWQTDGRADGHRAVKMHRRPLYSTVIVIVIVIRCRSSVIDWKTTCQKQRC